MGGARELPYPGPLSPLHLTDRSGWRGALIDLVAARYLGLILLLHRQAMIAEIRRICTIELDRLA